MPRLAGLGLLVAQVACSSPDPNLYTIAPISAATQTGAPKVIALRQIGLARYLERSQIVRSSENYRLDVMSNDWWGEPLGSMLARVLVDELSQRLPQSTVYAETGAVSVSPDATIELNVSRLDQNAAGLLDIAGAGRGDVQRARRSDNAQLPLRGTTDRSQYCRRGRGDQQRGRPAGRWACDDARHWRRYGAVTSVLSSSRRNPNSPGRACMNARVAGCCSTCLRSRQAFPRTATVVAPRCIARGGTLWSTALR